MDFGEVARKKREQFENEQIEKTKKYEDQRLSSLELLNRQVMIVKTQIKPVLEEAKLKCMGEGIDLITEEHFEVASYTVPRRPMIKLQAMSPRRKADGYQAASTPAFFEADEEKVYVSRGASSIDRSGKTPFISAAIGEHIDIVNDAIVFVIDSYFKEYPSWHWLGE